MRFIELTVSSGRIDLLANFIEFGCVFEGQTGRNACPTLTMDQILIIDDDVARCELVTEYLEPLGFQIESIHRGDADADSAD